MLKLPLSVYVISGVFSVAVVLYLLLHGSSQTKISIYVLLFSREQSLFLIH